MGAQPFLSAVRRRAAAGVLFVGAFAVGLAPSADGDLWWHLAAGREIVRTRGLLSVDSFSVSAAGRPWVDVHWLFQLVAYGIHAFGGLAALVLAKCLLVAMGALVLQAAVKRAVGPRLEGLFVAALLVALILARQLLPVRPVVVTLLLMALFFRALEQFRRDGKAQVLWALPLLQIVWANVQGLFALGPAMVAAYALGAALRARSSDADRRASRALAATLLLCVLASCVTPYGLAAFALPASLLGRLMPVASNVYSGNVAENVPPLILEQLSGGQFWHLKWFLGGLAVSLVMGRRRLLLAHVLLVIGLVALALAANRNVLLLYWLGTPIAIMWAAPAARRSLAVLRRFTGARWQPWLSWAALASLLGVLGVVALREPAFGQPAPFRVPSKSARIIAEHPGRGTIFAADHYGGYLIWKLFPRYRPYIDTRLILRTREEFAEYLALADHPERFDDFQRLHRFDYAVLPTAYPERYLGLAAHLYSSLEWKLVFTDGTESLFARRDLVDTSAVDLASPATTDAVLRMLDEQFRAAPRLDTEARLELATLDLAVGATGQAERVLEKTPGPAADALRARARLASGDLTGAREIAERLLSSDPADVGSLNVLAILSLRQGQPRQAVHLLRRALDADPFDGEAERILSGLEEHVASR